MSVCLACHRPWDGPELHCPKCRAGETPVEAKLPARSEAEIRREIVGWCYVRGAIKVLDMEQGYRADRCPHCGQPLGRGNTTTRVVRGFPDLVVFWRPPRPVWWIECKSARGKQTEHQLAFQRWVLASGGIYLLARSVEDCEELERRLAA